MEQYLFFCWHNRIWLKLTAEFIFKIFLELYFATYASVIWSGWFSQGVDVWSPEAQQKIWIVTNGSAVPLICGDPFWGLHFLLFSLIFSLLTTLRAGWSDEFAHCRVALILDQWVREDGRKVFWWELFMVTLISKQHKSVILILSLPLVIVPPESHHHSPYLTPRVLLCIMYNKKQNETKYCTQSQLPFSSQKLCGVEKNHKDWVTVMSWMQDTLVVLVIQQLSPHPC